MPGGYNFSSRSGPQADVADVAGKAREGHRYFVSPRQAEGCLATGVVIHRRFAGSVVRVHHSKIMSAVWLRAKQGLQGNDLRICIISAHAPSCIGREEVELDELARALQDLKLGRRTMVIMGADLNSTLKDIVPTDSDAHVGAAAELLDHMPSRNYFMEMLLDTTRGLRMTWQNSYKRWWKNAWNDDYQQLNNSEANPESIEVYTWEGHVFGHTTRRLIDYMGCDVFSAQRAVQGHVLRHLGFTTDHAAIGETYDMTTMGMNASTKKTRRPPKPIGWQIREDAAQQWNEGLQRMAEKRDPSWGYAELCDELKKMAPCGTSRAQRHSAGPRPRNTLEEALRDNLQKPKTTEERDIVRKKM